MPAKGLNGEQVAAWRMERHGLLRRGGEADWPEAVRRIGGLNARSLAAAELAVWARADGIGPEHIRRAWREERLLAKTWAMRGEPYLLPAGELPSMLSALRASAPDSYRKPLRLNGRVVTERQLDDITEATGAVLGGEPLTLERLAEAVAAHTGQDALRELLLSGAAELLRPAAGQGLLCFGPSDGERDTFVRPDQWIRRWSAPSEPPETILAEAAKRYLACCGPASYEDFGRWWGMDAGKAKRLFRALEGEIVSVTVDGREGWALRSAVDELYAAAIPAGTVRLLPQFDPYTVSLAQRSSSVLAETVKPRVYGSQGWVAAVVVVDGRFAGTWETEAKRGQVELRVDWFEPSKVRPQTRAALEDEAGRLVEYYESELILRC